MHTHKFRVPKKLMVMFVFILVLVAIAVSLSLSAFDSIAGDTAAEVGEAVQASATAPPPTPYKWSSTPEAIPVAGCIASEPRNRCQCFSAKGVTLDLSHAACLSVIASPFPRNITAYSDNKKD